MARIILSASRRTDIPAFYMPWFMDGIEQGFFEVENPYNRKISIVPATPDKVHTIVFWSKDFGPFIDQGCGERLTEMGYRLFFNFTINTPHSILEPGIVPLHLRLTQLSRLCNSYGPRCIQWRFDPICHFTDRDGHSGNNLDAFTLIADHVGFLGIDTCIASFVDLYRKIDRRMTAQFPLTLYEPSTSYKCRIIEEMVEYLGKKDIILQLCCEKEVMAALSPELPVRAAACIPGHRLIGLFGPDISIQQDTGQRTREGCGCNLSRDIGSYRLHPCRHNCLYCYANPA